MNIDRLDLIAYGHLTEISVDLSATPHRFHVIVGANESGKSTSMRAINAWLFGFPHQTLDDYAHLGTRLRVGGVLRDGATTLACIRRKGRKTTLRGQDDETVVDEGQLQTMLGGVDQQAFGTQFALSHDELRRGGSQILQGQGELGEMLFAAGAGLGRLRKIQDQLRADFEALFKSRGKTELNEAFKVLKELRGQLKAAQVPPAEYSRLQSELDKQRGQITQLKRSTDQLSSRRAAAAAALEALPIIPQWRAATAELAEVIDAPLLSEDFAVRRRDWNADQAVAENTLRRLANHLKELRLQLESIGEDLEIRKNKVEIESLVRELPIREKAEADLAGSMSTVLAAQERDLRKGLHELALDAGVDPGGEASTPTDDLGRQVDNLRLSETQRKKVGRLAGTYEKLVAGVEDARGQLAKLHGRIKQAESELEKLPSLADGDAVGRLLDEIGPPTRLIEEVRQARANAQRWQQKCQTTQDRLGIAGSPQQVAQLELPDPAQVRRIAKSVDTAEEECRLARRRVADTQRQLDESEAQYEAAQAQIDLPTVEQLDAARRVRDRAIAAWTQQLLVPVSSSADHLAASDSDVSSELITLVRRADEIVDQLRTHHADVHRRATAAANVQTWISKRDQQTTELQRYEAEFRSAQQAWESLWSSIGVTAQSSETMTVWMGEHEKLIEHVERLDDARSAAHDATAKINLAILRLRTVLEEPASDEDAVDGLLRLHEQASVLRHQRQQLQKQHDSLVQQLHGWRSDLPEAEATLLRRTEALAGWQQQWDEATSSLQTASPTPDEVLPMLDAIKDLTSLKKERDDMLRRMSSIRNETTAFLRSAQRLIATIEGDPIEPPPAEQEDTAYRLQRMAPKIHALHERSKQESIDADARQRLLAQIAKLDQEWAEAYETQQRLEVIRDELCQQAGCDDPTQLATIEARSQRRRIATERVRQAEANLTRLAGGKPILEFVEPIENVQPGVIEDQLSAADEQKERLNTQLEEAQRELGRLDQQLSAVDGGEEASDVAQQIQWQLGGIGRDAENYVRLKIAWAILRRAIEHYRSENQEPILKVAEAYFRTLTCGRYAGLKIDYDDKDTPLLHGISKDGDVPAGAMSAGTADALYLSLRLASLKHQAEHGKPMPLIVDDCLIQLDDARAAAALKVFSELSRATQVILFTHHQHLVELASANLGKGEFHLHQLGT